MKEILENNKLIAEFMGQLFVKKVKDTAREKRYKSNYDSPQELLESSAYNVCYHNSWDWLMPVIKKIRKIGDIKKKYSLELIISFENDTEIMNLYEKVVEFIKWYNKEEENESNSQELT